VLRCCGNDDRNFAILIRRDVFGAEMGAPCLSLCLDRPDHLSQIGLELLQIVSPPSPPHTRSTNNVRTP
jgi:hypothetical protein